MPCHIATCSPVAALVMQLPAGPSAPRKAAVDGLSAWAPTTNVGDPNGISDS